MEEKITVKSETITRLQEWEGRLIGRVGEKIKRKCGEKIKGKRGGNYYKEELKRIVKCQ